MRRWSPLLTVTAALLLLLNNGSAQQKIAEIEVERDVVYGKGGDQELQLDIARPEGKGPFPAVVCIHGGGWRAGKRQDLTKLTEVLARRGFVAATITYRLSPEHKFPAQIEDCKAAVRWLRANAEKYHVDRDHVGAIGFSAGGHLACLLAAAGHDANLEGKGGNPEQSSRVQAAVSFFGPTDLVSRTWDKKAEATFLIPFLGGAYEDKKELYRQASPLAHVSKECCPCLFFHGDKDRLVAISNSEKMVKRLQEVGVYARLVTMENEGHGWSGAKLTQTIDQACEFLKDKLKK